MAKDFSGSEWNAEVEKAGLEQALLSRLEFHTSLEVKSVSKLTGRSPQTIRKHFRRLVEDRKAKWSVGWEDVIEPIRIS